MGALTITRRRKVRGKNCADNVTFSSGFNGGIINMFAEHEICYECACVQTGDRDCLEISTWVYLGYVKTKCGDVNCEIPNHFYKFCAYRDYLTWTQKPEFDLPCFYIVTKKEVESRFLDRKRMIESASYWHQELLDANESFGD